MLIDWNPVYIMSAEYLNNISLGKLSTGCEFKENIRIIMFPCLFTQETTIIL